MKKALYIISHEKDGRHGHGPFRSIEFYCLNHSVPQVKSDTVTYSVEKMNGERDYITVSLIHTIQTDA